MVDLVASGPPFDMGLAAVASAFEAYTRRASAIDGSFSGPGEIAQGLMAGAG